MPITNAAIDAYALNHTSEPGELYAQLANEVMENLSESGMMSGPTVGYFLNTLAFAIGARRILEVGTFVGYSSLMMASALPDDGELITCDVDPDFTSIARRYWGQSPHGDKITLKLGPALETMSNVQGGFDLIFIDADKENYSDYYERALELIAPHGVIVIDNVLWGGRVLNPIDESGRAIAALNDQIVADERVNNVILTVRDGLMVVRKRNSNDGLC